MPYEHRFGCTSKRPKDWRHDPAGTGIFIHGGTCNAGPFSHTGVMSGANRFGVTIPTRNKRGQEFTLAESVRGDFRRCKTFQQAVNYAKTLQYLFAELATCDIFACTDLHMETTYSGRYEVQRVA